MTRLWISLGAANGFVAVALGAFAAHSLGDRLSPEALGWVETGARYQLYHALAMITVAFLALREIRPSSILAATGWAFLLGTILFSGSLYAMALVGWQQLSVAVPVGGVGLLIGWGALTVYGFSAHWG